MEVSQLCCDIKSNGTKSVRSEYLLSAGLFLAWWFQVLFILHSLFMTNPLQIEPDSNCIRFDKVWHLSMFSCLSPSNVEHPPTHQLEVFLQ